jgi:hypothetical protein
MFFQRVVPTRRMSSATDLETVAEDVLPSFEKFLPERILRRRLQNTPLTT